MLVRGKSKNTVYGAIKCSPRRCCKECDYCLEQRGIAFVQGGAIFMKWRKLNYQIVISLPLQNKFSGDEDCEIFLQDRWTELKALNVKLSKVLSGQIGPFIRVAAIGKDYFNPHVHFIIQKKFLARFYRVVQRIEPKIVIAPESSDIYDYHRWLGYLYHNNFLFTYNLPGRPKNIRLLSGSRKMSYGFPSNRYCRLLWKFGIRIFGR